MRSLETAQIAYLFILFVFGRRIKSLRCCVYKLKFYQTVGKVAVAED